MTKKQTIVPLVISFTGGVLFFVTTALEARVLQPAWFGEYAFIVALVTTVSIPVTIGLSQTLTRETAYAKARGTTSELPATWLWAFRWAFLVASGVGIALSALAISGLGGPVVAKHYVLGIALLFVLPLPRVLCGALHGLGHVATSLVPEQIVRPTLIIPIVVALWFSLDTDRISVSQMLSILVFVVAIEAFVSAALLRWRAPFRLRDGLLRLPPASRRTLGFSAVTFGAIASIHLLNSNLDVIMLGFLASGAETGIYKSAAVLAGLVVFGLGVTNDVIMPRIAGLHATGESEALQTLVTHAARLITALALAGFLIILFGGAFLLTTAFGENYAAGYNALLILAVGQLVNAFFGPTYLVLSMTGNEKLSLIGLGASVAVNAILNVVLIPLYGIEGAATATATSLVVLKVVMAIVLRRRTGFNTTIVGRRR